MPCNLSSRSATAVLRLLHFVSLHMEKPSSAVGTRATILIYLIYEPDVRLEPPQIGLVLRETDGRISYRDRYGTPKFISRRWAIHTEPCPSCPDHPNTKYPDALEISGDLFRLEAVAHGGSLGFYCLAA
jgi:hypothetical protein